MNMRTRTRACARTHTGTETRKPPARLRTRMPLLRARAHAYPHAHAHTRTHARARARAHAQARTRTRTRGGDLGDQTRVCPTANETFYGTHFTGFKRMLKMLHATFFDVYPSPRQAFGGLEEGMFPGHHAQPSLDAVWSHPRRDHHVPAMTITSPP